MTTTRRPSRTTWFAPPGRATPEHMDEEVRQLAEHDVVSALMRSFGGMVAVLNPERQIIAFNRSLLNASRADDSDHLIGTRLGEALACKHADAAPSGCGTGIACRTCGLTITLLQTMKDLETHEGECLLQQKDGDGIRDLQFRVRTAPLRLGDQTYTVVSMLDITENKRFDALQHTFLHDLANMVFSVQGRAELLAQSTPDAPGVNTLLHSAERLSDELNAHRELLGLHTQGPKVHDEPIDLVNLLAEVEAFALMHAASHDRQVQVELPEPGSVLHTSPALALRVISNMVVNALEATPARGTVRVWTTDGHTVHVWNPTTIPPEVAARIFQPHFSTKGTASRGLGTYSMRLIGERTLGGKVDFSTGETGTEFRFWLP